jgi:ADP-dependent NAD(P)H-hydrate dehydratase / NAD(P)H-hydrate epimerase
MHRSVDLPHRLYNAEQCRELDRLAIQQYDIPGYVLMQRAARAAWRSLLRHWPHPTLLTIYCGGGNNGGDGLVLALLAREKNIPTDLYLLADPESLRGEAKQAYADAVAGGVVILRELAAAAPTDGVVVDALLGTGLSGAIREPYRTAIEQINATDVPRLSLDIPSGLCSETGDVVDVAVLADLTITFIGMKLGLLTGKGPTYCGEVQFDGLGVPEPLYDGVQPLAMLCQLDVLRHALMPRPAHAHKGLYGHVLVIGGDHGMAGAVAMAAEAAARMGAGLTSVATRPEHVTALTARRPELMVHGVTSGQMLQPLLERATVVVIGPGLGRSPWAEQLLQAACAAGKPMVVDADALNLLAEGRVVRDSHRDNWILTPHPGEAARLSGTDSHTLQQDRVRAVRALAKRYGGVVVLKGAGTVIDDGVRLALCCDGNPGMASGGMGDVLSGLVAGLLAQGVPAFLAAQLAVTLHAQAADLAASRDGELGLLATDLLPFARQLLNGCLP